MLKRLIGAAAVWRGRRRGLVSITREGDEVRLQRYIAASLTDETVAWALGTWRDRYL